MPKVNGEHAQFVLSQRKHACWLGGAQHPLDAGYRRGSWHSVGDLDAQIDLSPTLSLKCAELRFNLFYGRFPTRSQEVSDVDYHTWDKEILRSDVTESC